jgi:hypothetical protein
MKITEPIGTDIDGSAFTITTRYGNMGSTNITKKRFPMTAVCEHNENTPPYHNMLWKIK